MDWWPGLFLPSHLLVFVLVVPYLQGEILFITEDQGGWVTCHRSLAQADGWADVQGQGSQPRLSVSALTGLCSLDFFFFWFRADQSPSLFDHWLWWRAHLTLTAYLEKKNKKLRSLASWSMWGAGDVVPLWTCLYIHVWVQVRVLGVCVYIYLFYLLNT